MRTLKVGWDNWFVAQDQGGSGGYASRLSKRLVDSGDVRLESLNGFGRNAGLGTVGRKLHHVSGFYWTHIRLPRILKSQGFDLLHAPAFIAPVSAPCPIVVTVHDITPILYPSHFATWWGMYFKFLMPWVLRSAGATVCGSEHTKQDIIKTFAIAPDKVWVTPYGVEHERFHPAATLDPGWAQGIGLRDGYLLHVGALAERKDVPTLLRALARVRSSGALGSRQLLLAGAQTRGLTGAEEVFQTIRELDLNENVILAGHVPNEHLPGLYAGASILVMPSLYEGFGFPILEAMATGTPVVASNTSSIPEVAGEAAVLFPPQDEHALADAIQQVLRNEALAQQLRDRGLLQAAQFTWERTARETVKVYESVVRH